MSDETINITSQPIIILELLISGKVCMMKLSKNVKGQ